MSLYGLPHSLCSRRARNGLTALHTLIFDFIKRSDLPVGPIHRDNRQNRSNQLQLCKRVFIPIRSTLAADRADQVFGKSVLPRRSGRGLVPVSHAEAPRRSPSPRCPGGDCAGKGAILDWAAGAFATSYTWRLSTERARIPSFNSSPWMRGAPHSGLSTLKHPRFLWIAASLISRGR